MEHTTNPLDEQEIFCVKARIPELETVENVGPYAKVHYFNGPIQEASSELTICGKTIAGTVLMKPNCSTAISQSNKRYLASFEVPTDYEEPNPLLFRALGFSEQQSKILVYAHGLDVLPVNTVVTAYNLGADNSALPTPLVEFQMKNGMAMAEVEAIKVIADWLSDNGYVSNFYEDFMEYEDIEAAWLESGVSPEAREYGELLEEEPWEQLEAACLYECATYYVSDLILQSNAVYSLLHKKYDAAGIILANLNLEWGLNEDTEPVLCNEVATTDSALLASKDLYEKNGTLNSMINRPVLEYFESVGYDVTSEEPVPDVPEDVMDEVSDTYLYLAEAICDDLAFDLHM